MPPDPDEFYSTWTGLTWAWALSFYVGVAVLGWAVSCVGEWRRGRR